MWYTYLWEFVDEDSEYYGEQFFTELKSIEKAVHTKYAKEIFPDEELRCLGRVSEYMAEEMGLDTY